MKQRLIIVFIFFLTIQFIPAACGKKGPPFLSKGVTPLKVEQLEAKQKDGAVFLKGNLIAPKGRTNEASDIIGCRVYHAHFTLEDPPCEGCPIEYQIYKDIEDEVIIQEKFSCHVPEIKKRGIHFFKVRLFDKKRELGQFSDGAKLIIAD